ncbi:MAG: metallophosphoesterase [Chloroflexota bacterium]
MERSWLHVALVISNGLSRLSWPAMAVILVALALAVGVVWRGVISWAWAGWLAGGLYLLFAAADWLLLWLLPRRNMAYGPVEPPLMALAALRWALALMAAALVVWPGLTAGASLIALTLAFGAISALSVYAVAIEPFRLGVTEMTLCSPRLSAQAPSLRVLQMGDLHIERLTRRERELSDRIVALAPDLILLTGDYLNLSYVYDGLAIEQARAFLGRLQAPFGVYAVAGSPPVDPPETVQQIFQGLGNVRLLQNESSILDVRGQRIGLVGVTCSHDLQVDAARLDRSLADVPSDTFTLLLYHSPDLMPEMASRGVDLYLAGHTHGGQIRLPFLGAILTSSAYGKRYEMGHYRQGRTQLYVARGVGMEGLGAPRARLLCPPEIVLWTLAGCG